MLKKISKKIDICFYYCYLLIMNQVCEFIKDYIKSDRKYIHLNFNEDYSTLIEEKENIIK